MQRVGLFVLVFIVGGGLGAAGMRFYSATQITTLTASISACQTTEAAAAAKIKAFNSAPFTVAKPQTFQGGYK